MGYLEDRMAAIGDMHRGAGMIGLLGWVDPCGDWWIAPLGSEPPNTGRPMPGGWVPIKRLRREEPTPMSHDPDAQTVVLDSGAPASFTCPRCGRASYNPYDLAYRYCGHCHVFVDDDTIGEVM